MADFLKAYKKVAASEGGYVNDPDDAGGETYKGIARRSNPTWIGWSIIDDLKKHHNLDIAIKLADQNSLLQKAVVDLYKKLYWDCFQLDKFDSQIVAEQLFDTNVNCGKSAAIKLAQRVLDTVATGKMSNDLNNLLASIS